MTAPSQRSILPARSGSGRTRGLVWAFGLLGAAAAGAAAWLWAAHGSEVFLALSAAAIALCF